MEQLFKQVSEAYETLYDTEKRSRYDDRYEKYFHEQRQQQTPTPSKPISPGRNLLFHLNISFIDAFRGTEKTVKYVHLKNGIRTTSNLLIKVPSGIRDQQKLRVRKAGESNSKNQPPGDLLVVVHIQPDPLFQVLDSDITMKIPIGPLDLLLKDDITIPTLDGKTTLQIPALKGAQHPTLRLKQKGLFLSDKNKKRGDLFVQFVIEVPEVIDENLKNAITELKKKIPKTQGQQQLLKRLE